MRRCFFFLAVLCAFASCEKDEDAIVLPPRGTASYDSVVLGESYDKQIFYDFESGMPVFTSDPKSWDLAFEATPEGRHIFINGGQDVWVYNTHKKDLAQVKTLPQGLSATSGAGWQYDKPSLLPDATGMGEWQDTSVYIVQLRSGLQKLRVLSGDDSGYVFEWMPLSGSGAPTRVALKKDTAFNYVCFSFSKGITQPEPIKGAWDIVFTHYRELVYDGSLGYAVPYLVTGVLLNPWKTSAAADSVDEFSGIGLNKAQTALFSERRNVIGYDWKTVDLGGGSFTYTVNRRKNYIVSTRREQLYKMHFLGFYSSTGIKGTPTFEFERLK